MRCKLCARKVKAESGSLCDYHLEAMETLKRGHGEWNEAYSGISWREYLNRVKTLAETGQWIKEVIALEEGSSD
jgi:DNA topoisomerase I